MTNRLDSEEVGFSRGDHLRKRSYLREFGPAMALYVGTIVVTTSLGVDRSWKQWLFVGLNMLPVLLMAWAILRHLRRLDEFERLKTMEAMTVGFGVAMVTALGCALTASAGIGISALVAAWAPFMAGMAAWGLLACLYVRST
jgi:hypothetical protein